MLRAVGLLFLLCAISVAAMPDRPNVVWLVSEDSLAEWLRLYHPDGAAMPNIERLAKEGLVFNHVYSCGAVCSVALSTIISGCYAPRTGTQYHRRHRAVSMPDLSFIPEPIPNPNYAPEAETKK